MKVKGWKLGYLRLKLKILMQLVLMAAGAFLTFFFVYRVFVDGRMADRTVALLQKLLFVEYEDALRIYQYYIRNHEGTFIWMFVAAVFFLFFYFSMTWFVRYFRQIDRGLEALLSGTEQEIVLSRELEALEKKMNLVKRTLEKRELETTLARQRKDDLVMYLAHDIRTPLTSVIGYLSLLEEVPDMPAEQKEKYVRITLEKACRLETLINEFFEITRYDSRQTVLEKETIALSYMMVQMADEFYPMLTANGNTVEIRIPEDMSIFGDSEKLARVFQNILKNAVSYSTPQTAIVLRAEESEREVCISIENQGKTIPPQKLSVIFEKFYRLDDARTTEKGGAGLGLAIAREIVSLHGGRISAESEDGRTIFRVILPRQPGKSPLSGQ